jgi:hypothetical protein
MSLPDQFKTPPARADRKYELRISRLTVEKLGVKLYDRVSAVVAELIANGYDADAEEVKVRLPLSTLLATKQKQGPPKDNGYDVEVEDNGHGMTHDEAIDFYLNIGRDRRLEAGGKYARSREKKRPVMGRKGIGKLAPFGICRVIEIISSGGDLVVERDVTSGKERNLGYRVAHFILNYDAIVAHDTDERVPLESGAEEGSFRPKRGTIIRMRTFLPKRIPDAETFHRQLATRFLVADKDFKIIVEDTRDPAANPPSEVQRINAKFQPNTFIDLSTRAVPTEDGQSLPVKGWIAMGEKNYEYEETAGIRIYARGKFVATTRDFEQVTGFHGEFTVRSYIIGEVHADWLDDDKGDDLIRSDRQGIIWESDYGRALQTWGANLIKEVGKMSKEPRRKRVREIFLEKSNIVARAAEAFEDKDVAKAAVVLAEQLGSFANEDALEEPEYVEDLTEIVLTVAPYKALIDAFRELGKTNPTLDEAIGLLGKVQIAELTSYGHIVWLRIKAIKQLEKCISDKSDEMTLQELIADSPWLISPTWTPLTKNQPLVSFKKSFEAFYKEKYNAVVSLAIDKDFKAKRPDFILIGVERKIRLVELKAPGHPMGDGDMKRLVNYVAAFREFFEAHNFFREEFPDGFQIDLIVDSTDLKEAAHRNALNDYQKLSKELRVLSWHSFLGQAEKANEKFLEVNRKLVGGN